MNESLLKDKIRKVTEEDRNLPTFSYSKIDQFKSCPFAYDLKYNQKKYTSDTSLALELGSLCHLALELKGKSLVQEEGVDYDKLNKIIQEGYSEINEKTKEVLLGTNELKKKYFDIWWEKCSASNMTYDEKMQVFDKVLHEEMENTDWTPYLFEYPFEFVWDNRVIIKGFIDRIDIKDGEYRTVDYKTSKKIYDKSKLPTSLQFGIYALAILNDFDKLPVESLYRFILIDDEQKALTLGWEKRLIKALNKVFDTIENDEKENLWKPSPSPLCHWCNFCATNPNAKDFKHDCEYYSLWTPEKKNFSVNKEFDPNKQEEPKRKLIF